MTDTQVATVVLSGGTAKREGAVTMLRRLVGPL